MNTPINIRAKLISKILRTMDINLGYTSGVYCINVIMNQTKLDTRVSRGLGEGGRCR